jgi:hypothetical protein
MDAGSHARFTFPNLLSILGPKVAFPATHLLALADLTAFAGKSMGKRQGLPMASILIRYLTKLVSLEINFLKKSVYKKSRSYI